MTKPGDVLLSPWVLLSVAVLLLNDHVLKWQFGNVITGKLSDVAGVFLLPLMFLAAVEAVRALWAQVSAERSAEALGHTPRWAATRADIVACVAVVGVGFAAVKTLPWVGDAYETVIGTARSLIMYSSGPAAPIVVYRDPTDVMVLPVLILTFLLASRRRSSGQAA
ncbi:MAG: hypothetical protein QM658_02775 [Gordonia sp. (in: high G+C Gram-positive bacteria)]